jgi:hypothetical protein
MASFRFFFQRPSFQVAEDYSRNILPILPVFGFVSSISSHYLQSIRIHALGGGFVSSIAGQCFDADLTSMHLALASFGWILEGAITVMDIPDLFPVEVGAQHSTMTLEHPGGWAERFGKTVDATDCASVYARGLSWILDHRGQPRYYAGEEDSHARAYEPCAPAREGMAAAAMHLPARRARMRIAPAPTPLGP